MDPDLQFPNPVERHDLPVPRKKWKYALAGGLILLLLAFVFLPQILSSKVGKNLLKTYLESQYRGQAWMTSFSTSWWGPTTVYQFSLTDPEGRQIRFNNLTSPISLWGLLFGSIDLGETRIDGLYIDYVIDYGDGTSTVDRLPKSFDPLKSSAISSPGQAPAASKPPRLPNISGKLNLTNAQFQLMRGQVLHRQQFRTVYRSLRFVAPTGRVEIASLDQPWTCQLEGKVGPDNNTGSFTVSGALDLGEDGILDWSEAAADLKISIRDLPNIATDDIGSLGWLLMPALSAQDYQQAFGPVLETLDIHIQGTEGRWQFTTLEAKGKTLDGRPTRLSAKPILELDRNPQVLTINEPAIASIALTPDLAAYLSYINPFLRDASTTAGWVDLTITELSRPMGRTPRPGTVRGRAKITDASLASGIVLDADPWPKELITQWQAITGNLSPEPKLNMPQCDFVAREGRVEVDPYDFTIDNFPLQIAGHVLLNGSKLEMNTKIASSSSQTLPAEISGTLEQPRLKITSESTDLAELFDKNLLQLRQRKSEKLLELSTKRVETMLEVYDRINRRQTAQ